MVAKPLDISGEELRDSLAKITSQLEQVLEGQAMPTGGFGLESFTVGLAVEGKGKVALVAELGVQASIQLTFTRRSER